jgi:hypothetical protein
MGGLNYLYETLLFEELLYRVFSTAQPYKIYPSLIRPSGASVSLVTNILTNQFNIN